MKVAHLTTVDMSLRYLLLPQLEAALDVGEVLGISGPGEFVEELEAKGIRHIPLTASTRGMDLLADLKSAIQLWRVLREERPDVLHTHNPKPGFYGRIVGRLAGVPVVVNTVHGLYATPESSLIRRSVVYASEWLASRFSDAELVQSPEDFDLLSRMRILRWPNLTLLGNGVDLGRFNPEGAAGSRHAMREELGVKPEQIVVGMVGRLVSEKGVPELIEAAGELDNRYVVVVAGPSDPSKADAISDEVLDSARDRGIRFLGHRRDVDRLYGAFDVFVLPSHREGFPRAAMEAAASGLPVIATDIRGCRQVVDPGSNGLLVPVRDPVAMAEAIRQIGSDLGLRRRMSEASVEKARREFDERVVVEKVMATYAGVGAQKGLALSRRRVGEDLAMRPGRVADARAVAEMHLRSIHTGFLPSLGRRFMRVLYKALISSAQGVVLVAETEHGSVVGFVAGTADTGGFYREFVRSRGLAAAAAVFPALLKPRNFLRALETLRYGSNGDAKVKAELLAMAVSPAWRGAGLGSQLVHTFLDWAETERLDAVKVVVGAENPVAAGLYRSSGFGSERSIEIHQGETSLEMVWRP